MKTEEIDKLIDLAKFYNNLGCLTLKELSKRTYSLREAGEDIPYIDCTGWLIPTLKQKNWKFLKETYLPDDIRTQNGHITLRVVEFNEQLYIVIFQHRLVANDLINTDTVENIEYIKYIPNKGEFIIEKFLYLSCNINNKIDRHKLLLIITGREEK